MCFWWWIWDDDYYHTVWTKQGNPEEPYMLWAPCFCSPSRLNHGGGGGWSTIHRRILRGIVVWEGNHVSNLLFPTFCTPLSWWKHWVRCFSFQHLFVVETSLVRSNMFEKPRSIAGGRWCKISVGRNLSPPLGRGKPPMDQDLFAESSWDRDWRPGTDPSESHLGWSLINLA